MSMLSEALVPCIGVLVLISLTCNCALAVNKFFAGPQVVTVLHFY